MPELIATILFLVALVVIEVIYIVRGEKTISEHVHDAVFSWRPLPALVGFVVGWLFSHLLS